ncbi:NAD(P)/FAD-dependent oxidoreductase [Georgenia yuyongxinii]|uniref:NAD(P)/FAD-dependent oxidoreductase n=1 Tax=Georgenia yuyongxinii TaxID=2589797 RepID=A0A552WMX9_9MICO|nr:FAD-dependent oxidoreductase [Georgenia yuyongxinii]TRW43863.1 NAD(P)/FAD-dependent oxidoreductase [Georgenia yuyongxinii]
MDRHIVIVGAGLAGAKAAQTLRKEGFDGAITLVGQDPERPYIRPPLSKDYLMGKEEREAGFVHPQRWYPEHDVTLLLGRRAETLDVAARRVTLDSGEPLPYTGLLLATGSSPRRLTGSGSGEGLTGVHYLRTRADSDVLRADLADGGRRVAIVGAGWIGLEVAAAARGYGNDVTVLGREAVPLEGPLGPELGAIFAAVHREHGVDLRMSTTTGEILGHDGAVTGVMAHGEVVPADVVVVGIGAVPNDELARAAGLTVDNGVVVDASLRASAPGVWAAGDVARAFHPRLGHHHRVEHWANALRSGPAAARSLLGQDVTFDQVPYFYTDQFDLGMEYSGFGDLTADARVVYRGDPATREFVAFWVRDSRVVAGMNVNVWDVNKPIDALIRSGAPVDEARLTDAGVPLEELAAAPAS